jgi:hypothetical protein
MGLTKTYCFRFEVKLKSDPIVRVCLLSNSYSLISYNIGKCFIMAFFGVTKLLDASSFQIALLLVVRILIVIFAPNKVLVPLVSLSCLVLKDVPLSSYIC